MAGIRLMGSKITRLSGERNDKYDGEIKVTTNLSIVSTEMVKDPKDVLKVNYRFEVDYGDLGKVMVEGALYLSSDTKTLKEIQKNSKEQRMNEANQVLLANLILQKASIRCFEIEEELSLPLHVKLPALKLKE